MKQRIKLSAYAKLKGVTYRTAWNWYKAGYLNAEKLVTGTILIVLDENN